MTAAGVKTIAGCCAALAVAAPGALAQDAGTGGASPSGGSSNPSAGPRVAPDLVARPGAVQHGEHVDAYVAATKVAFGAPQAPQLHYTVKGDQPLDVTVDVVRMPDGLPIARVGRVTAPPGVEQTATWNGLAGTRVPRAGRYAFRVFVSPAGSTAQAAQSAGPDVTGDFAFVPQVFPVAGPYRFGDGAGRFGAGRPGYSHQGQDIFADCGTPLVAARAAKVKFKAFQSRAGNYIVLDADKTGRDMAYMHLRDPALVDKGDHVATGQVIGYVGDTGDAVGCHLHFELWTAPGWYTGGKPVDPLPSLQAWAGSSASAARASSRSRGSSSRGR